MPPFPSGRSFTADILAKIVAVVPKSYLLRQELIKDRQLGEGRYELVILPSRLDTGRCSAKRAVQRPACAGPPHNTCHP